MDLMLQVDEDDKLALYHLSKELWDKPNCCTYRCVAWSPSCDYIAAVDTAGTLLILDAANGKALKKRALKCGEVSCCFWAARYSHAAAAIGFRQLRISAAYDESFLATGRIDANQKVPRRLIEENKADASLILCGTCDGRLLLVSKFGEFDFAEIDCSRAAEGAPGSYPVQVRDSGCFDAWYAS